MNEKEIFKIVSDIYGTELTNFLHNGTTGIISADMWKEVAKAILAKIKEEGRPKTAAIIKTVYRYLNCKYHHKNNLMSEIPTT
jgi:hypothetical protein